MAVTSRKSIRDKIVSVLDGITAITGTKKTIMTRLRSSAQDYEGYIFRVRLRSSADSLASADIRNIVEQWTIEQFSPKTGLGNEALKEDQMYDYADLVQETFMANQNLDNFASISGGFIVANSCIWQSDTSLDDNPRSKWTFTLQIERQEVC